MVATLSLLGLYSFRGDILDNFKGFLVNNGFVGVLKNNPFGRVIVDLFL